MWSVSEGEGTHEGWEEVEASHEQKDLDGQLPHEEDVRNGDPVAVQEKEKNHQVTHFPPVKLLGNFSITEKLHFFAGLALSGWKPNIYELSYEWE